MRKLVLFSLNNEKHYNILFNEFNGLDNIEIRNLTSMWDLSTDCSAIAVPGTVFGNTDIGIIEKYAEYFYTKSYMKYNIFNILNSIYGCIQPLTSCNIISFSIYPSLAYTSVMMADKTVLDKTFIPFNAMYNMLTTTQKALGTDKCIASPILCISDNDSDFIIAAKQMRIAYDIFIKPIDILINKENSDLMSKLINTLNRKD